jgi:hypothetical protein
MVATMTTPGLAAATAWCSIRLSPGGHSTVDAMPQTRARTRPGRTNLGIYHPAMSRGFIQRRRVEAGESLCDGF